MTVTIKMSGQGHELTSKTVERTKGIGDCDSENDWTSKNIVRTKEIGDCDSENE